MTAAQGHGSRANHHRAGAASRAGRRRPGAASRPPAPAAGRAKVVGRPADKDPSAKALENVMTGRINGVGVNPAETGTTRRADTARSQGAAERPGAAASGAAAGARASADKVELTPSAVLLQRLEESIRNSSDVDAERVRSTKEAIASGEYRVDDERVAAKLAALDRELR